MRVADLRVGLLFYCVGTENIYSLLIDQEGHLEKFDLIRWEKAYPRINMLFDALQGSYAPNEAVAHFNSFSFEWGKEILPPIEYLDPFDILVIIPHHTLHGLPFHTIWLEKKEQFLGLSHGVSYCSSGTLFTRCVDRNSARRGELSGWQYSLAGEAAVAAPAPPESCLALGADILTGKNEQYKHLTNTFAKYFNKPITFGHSNVDVSAPRIALKNRIRIHSEQKADAVCLVSHGYHDLVLSENSGLLLEADPFGGILKRSISFGEQEFYFFRDQPLSYLPAELEPQRRGELMTLSELKVDCYTEAQLIALFACSSGAGQVISGDDFNSLAYQWLKIGASSVLANLWDLDIDLAVEWAPYFLDNWLIKRYPKAIAYQQAFKQLIGRNPQTKPIDWGAVTLFGDWL